MENVLLKMITDENDNLLEDKIKTLCPKYMEPKACIKHAMHLLSKTPLPDSFLAKHFEQLDIRSLIVNTDIPEDLFKKYMPQIANNLAHIFLSRHGIQSESFVLFRRLGLLKYDTGTFDKLLVSIYNECGNVPTHNTQGMIDETSELVALARSKMSNMTNTYLPHKVSKEFILSNNNKGLFSLIDVYRHDKRFTEQDLLDNSDMISIDSLVRWEERIFHTLNMGEYGLAESDHVQLEKQKELIQRIVRIKHDKKNDMKTSWQEDE